MNLSSPEFIIFTGPMFGGKTSRMLATVDRAKYQKKKIALFKPKKDNRYAESEIRTHVGFSERAFNVVDGADICKLAENYDVIAVDEAFMIPGCGQALINLFRNGKTIYVSSIQLSSKGEPFDEMTQMFPWATRVVICPAVCTASGADAYYTIATKSGIDDIHVGGAETYEPRSFFNSNIFNSNQ